MEIGIILPGYFPTYHAGVPVQGRFWKEGLEALGHKVYLLNNWDYFDYESMDYVIIIGPGILYHNIVHTFKKIPNVKIVCAPIIDWPKPMWRFKFRSWYFGWHKGGFLKPHHELYSVCSDIDFFLVRSEFESRFVVEGLRVSPSRVFIVPVSLRIQNVPAMDFQKKENFCLHVSRLSEPGKNVERLVAAAKKYKFRLKLAGTLREGERGWLDKLIADTDQIEYLGRLSDEDLFKWYAKAKVFALPSIVEGVGSVALEAAVSGCEIALTNIGGPKEYYNGRAVLVNPYDVDSIGRGVLEAMESKNAQPELRDYILGRNNLIACSKMLEKVLIDNK